MKGTRWDKRFFESTRGRVLLHLRRSARTVSELAELLGLTDNAVRGHLAALERDGVVEQSGVRRGIGKPAHLYRPTAAAEEVFAKAASPILQVLLDVLADRLSSADFDSVLRETGRRMGAGGPLEGDGVRERLEGALAILSELGGMGEIEEENGVVRLRGYSCPLASVVRARPEACRIAEAAVAELVGAPVTEHCEKGERPRCVFEVAVEAGTTRG